MPDKKQKFLQFSTKAETLKSLEGNLANARILPQIRFTVGQLSSEPEKIKETVVSAFKGQRVIVRSSALSEDTGAESQAGKFLSVMDSAPEDVLTAANTVKDSFLDNKLENQIFVQPMLTDILLSGVVFTVDPNTGGNYFVINYDDTTGSTSSVTSGQGESLSTCYIFHGKKSKDERLNRVVEACNEIIALFGQKNIDIEFACTRDTELFILQARPLVMRTTVADFEKQSAALGRAYQFIKRNMNEWPYLKGRQTIYGVMPDWNPAEMIGLRPTPLSSSLYRRLITDGTWAYQRNEYGYRNLRSFPLMVEFCGLPYIDIRISFNSFIPRDIDDELSDKLANYYLDSLARNPDKHDKVEFDIVFSCYTFDLADRIQILSSHGFTGHDQDLLQNSLRRLTNNIINIKDGLWITDTEKIAILDERREIIINSDLDIISKIYWLLADCTRYGTLPFAGLARGGFIAVQLLKSLISIGILSQEDYQNYLGSLKTVSSQIAEDYQELSQSTFLRKYGHLRPGTYDLLSKRYDAAPEMYFGGQSGLAASAPPQNMNKQSFLLSLEQYAAIQQQMSKQNFEGDVLALFKFCKAAIEGREYSKFIFTKSLSYILELFAELGERYSLSRQDMSYLNCSVIDKLYSSTVDVRKTIIESMEMGKQHHAETTTFTMPPVIMSPDDIYRFAMPSGVPNFITLKEMYGEIYCGELRRNTISGKIVLISAADPGYDWIFSCNILGFITAYGGANSHMAIRASELGLPAVIGIGQKEFDRLTRVRNIHVDCANRKIEVIQ
jgi:phosphohistidine swiveling domain-containing protein